MSPHSIRVQCKFATLGQVNSRPARARQQSDVALARHSLENIAEWCVRDWTFADPGTEGWTITDVAQDVASSTESLTGERDSNTVPRRSLKDCIR